MDKHGGILRERSIGFMTGSRFFSDQFNARFKDLVSKKYIEPLDYEIEEKDGVVTFTLLGGIFIDHRGIRFDFYTAYPAQVSFKKSDVKSLVRISLFYDKMKDKNLNFELKAYMIDELNSYSGTEDGEDPQQSNLITFRYNSSGELEKVGHPYVLGEQLKRILDDHDRRIKELKEYTETNVARLDKKIDSVERSLTNKINSVDNRLSKKINDNYNELSSLMREMETRIKNTHDQDMLKVYDKISEEIRRLDRTLTQKIVDAIADIGEGGGGGGGGGGGSNNEAIYDLQDAIRMLEKEIEEIKNLLRQRAGVKKQRKDSEGTFEEVTTYDADGKPLTRSVLQNKNSKGQYTVRVLTLNLGTNSQKTVRMKIEYDSDGDVISETNM